MNYGLNNNTGRTSEQAINALLDLKNSINGAKSLKNKHETLKKGSGWDRLKTYVSMVLAGVGGGEGGASEASGGTASGGSYSSGGSYR